MSNLSKTEDKIALSQINVLFKLKYCLVEFVVVVGFFGGFFICFFLFVCFIWLVGWFLL